MWLHRFPMACMGGLDRQDLPNGHCEMYLAMSMKKVMSNSNVVGRCGVWILGKYLLGNHNCFMDKHNGLWKNIIALWKNISALLKNIICWRIVIDL